MSDNDDEQCPCTIQKGRGIRRCLIKRAKNSKKCFVHTRHGCYQNLQYGTIRSSFNIRLLDHDNDEKIHQLFKYHTVSIDNDIITFDGTIEISNSMLEVVLIENNIGFIRIDENRISARRLRKHFLDIILHGWVKRESLPQDHHIWTICEATLALYRPDRVELTELESQVVSMIMSNTERFYNSIGHQEGIRGYIKQMITDDNSESRNIYYTITQSCTCSDYTEQLSNFLLLDTDGISTLEQGFLQQLKMTKTGTCDNCGQSTTSKILDIHIPSVLIIECGEGYIYSYTEELHIIDDITYKLYAIIFWDNQQYTCNVKLPDVDDAESWYSYDDTIFEKIDGFDTKLNKNAQERFWFFIRVPYDDI
jgi:hypothetical protein